MTTKTPYRIDRITLHRGDDLQVVRDLVEERSARSRSTAYELHTEPPVAAKSLEEAINFIQQNLHRRYATVEVMLRNTLDAGNTRYTDFTNHLQVIVNVPSRSQTSTGKILEQLELDEQADAYQEELHQIYYDSLMP